MTLSTQTTCNVTEYIHTMLFKNTPSANYWRVMFIPGMKTSAALRIAIRYSLRR